MSTKTVELSEIGPITLVKSSRNKSMRLSITNDGKIRVSMPYWTPFSTAIKFVGAQKEWITQELSKTKPKLQFYENQKIGKLHRLVFEKTTDSVTSRVSATKIVIRYLATETITDGVVQVRAEKAVVRALKKEILQLLGPRTKNLAATYGFTYRTVGAKMLKRRWGSCDSQKNIIYNCFLMELPWSCIDYVILHELTHTEYLNHGDYFKARLKEVCPHVDVIRRQMKQYRPILQNQTI